MSINQKITISKDEILKKYDNLDTYFRNVIKALYGESNNVNIQCFNSKDIINLNKKNTIKMLSPYKNKTGVYIFLDDNDIPVYIGVAGKVGGCHSIKNRLQKQFNCDSTNGTLSKNIYDIETLIGNILINSNQIDKKKLILKYAPKLLVIEVGDLINPDDINISLALEQVLISLFNSKYNK
ncbi:MAG: hypothetical protein KAI79_19210 [Bacteroidales bacterium]|nr:hypothetical protein [Bacteroidales bacterium]